MRPESMIFAGLLAILIAGAAGVQTYRLSVAEERLETTQSALTIELARTAGLRNALREVELEAKKASARQTVASEGKQAVRAAADGENPSIPGPMLEAFKAADRIGGFE